MSINVVRGRMLSISQADANGRLYLFAVLSRSAMGMMESGERRLALFDPLVYQHLRHFNLSSLGVLLEWSNRLNESETSISAGQNLEQLPVDSQDLDELTTVDDRPLEGWLHAAIPFRARQVMYGIGIARLPLSPTAAIQLPPPWRQLDSVGLALTDSIEELITNLRRLSPEACQRAGITSRD